MLLTLKNFQEERNFSRSFVRLFFRSVWKALVICCEVLRSFYFQRLFLAVDCGDTYNQSFSLYNTVTLCPLLTASSSSTHGWKSCSTSTLWRGRDGSISSCSFSSPTRTNVSILAEPVMRPRGASVSLSLRSGKYRVQLSWLKTRCHCNW